MEYFKEVAERYLRFIIEASGFEYMTQGRLEAILDHVAALRTISKKLGKSIKNDLENVYKRSESASTKLKDLYNNPFGMDLAEDFMALFEAIRSVSLFFSIIDIQF
jgi:hypothetical protein